MSSTYKRLLSLVLALVVVFLVGSTSAAQEPHKAKEFWRAYSKMVQAFDFEGTPTHQGIYALIEIVKQVNAIDKPELSQSLWRRASKLVESEKKRQYEQQLFLAALTFDDLGPAVGLANKFEGKRRSDMLDSIDLERLKRGEKNALEEYPRVPLDFWKAVDHGKALVAAKQFDEADKFIRELDIPHKENDPRTVGAFVYEDIAAYYQQQGDLDNAKRYIDKAMAIGGNLYYTGFGVKVKKHSIYGEFDQKTLKKYQKLGVAYGSHMRRELLGGLINELAEFGKVEQAKQTVSYLENESDRDRYFSRIAIREASKGQSLANVETTIERITSEEVRASTRVSLVKPLYRLGRQEDAVRLLKSEIGKLKSGSGLAKKVLMAAGDVLGATCQTEKFAELFRAEADKKNQAFYLLAGIRGFAEEINRKKSNLPVAK